MRPNNLAIETSGRSGSISVGHDDELLQTVTLTQQRRHNVELLPAIAELCTPGELREVYVNVGPGSFTGLRIAVTAAKMLAMSLGAKLVAVEAVDVLAAQAPGHEHLAVCVNHKRDTVYARLYCRGEAVGEPRLVTVSDLLAQAPRPLTVLGHPLPDFDAPPGVTLLPPQEPRSETLWRLGRELAKQNRFADSATILPRYARPPEAVTLWQTRNQRAESRNP